MRRRRGAHETSNLVARHSRGCGCAFARSTGELRVGVVYTVVIVDGWLERDLIRLIAASAQFTGGDRCVPGSAQRPAQDRERDRRIGVTWTARSPTTQTDDIERPALKARASQTEPGRELLRSTELAQDPLDQRRAFGVLSVLRREALINLHLGLARDVLRLFACLPSRNERHAQQAISGIAVRRADQTPRPGCEPPS